MFSFPKLSDKFHSTVTSFSLVLFTTLCVISLSLFLPPSLPLPLPLHIPSNITCRNCNPSLQINMAVLQQANITALTRVIPLPRWKRICLIAGGGGEVLGGENGKTNRKPSRARERERAREGERMEMNKWSRGTTKVKGGWTKVVYWLFQTGRLHLVNQQLMMTLCSPVHHSHVSVTDFSDERHRRREGWTENGDKK